MNHNDETFVITPNGSEKRSRLRSYSLRSLFAILTLFGVLFAYCAYSFNCVRKHEIAIEALRSVDADLILTTESSRVISSIEAVHYRGINRLFGRPTMYAPLVTLTKPTHTPEVVRSMIPHLRNIIPKDGQNVAGMSFVGIVIETNPTFACVAAIGFPGQRQLEVPG